MSSTSRGPTRGRISRSPRVRTPASGSTSPNWRRSPPSTPCWIGGPGSRSTQARRRPAASSSGSRGHCPSDGTERPLPPPAESSSANDRRAACVPYSSRMDVVLVHGSYHGGWCWDRLRPELEARGHRVTQVDLPISDPTLGASEYADVVAAAIPETSEPVLVGHSMAGLVIPLVAARRPVRRLVFLAAFLAVPGVSANDQ